MKATAIMALALIIGLSGEARATTLRGTVRDAETHAPIGGAWITVQVLDPDSLAIGGISESDGGYEIQNMVTGNQIYALMAAVPGYGGFYARLDALGEMDLTYDLFLSKEAPPNPNPDPPDSGSFAGTVLAATGSTGQLVPLSGAAVTLVSGGNQIGLHTDAAGRYAAAMPLGIYAVQIDATGFASLHLSQIELGADGVTFDGVLRPTAVPAHPVTWGSVKATYR